jgi:hypothetical protein
MKSNGIELWDRKGQDRREDGADHGIGRDGTM